MNCAIQASMSYRSVRVRRTGVPLLCGVLPCAVRHILLQTTGRVAADEHHLTARHLCRDRRSSAAALGDSALPVTSSDSPVTCPAKALRDPSEERKNVAAAPVVNGRYGEREVSLLAGWSRMAWLLRGIPGLRHLGRDNRGPAGAFKGPLA